jgi:hypothetical protein
MASDSFQPVDFQKLHFRMDIDAIALLFGRCNKSTALNVVPCDEDERGLLQLFQPSSAH